MRYLYTLSVTALFYFNLNSQPGFIKTYDFGLNAAVFCNLLVKNDTLIGCALGQSLFPPYNNGIVFTKMDTFGNSYLTRFHMAENNYSYVVGDTPSGFIQLSDKSGYLYLGGVFEIKGVIVIKFNNDGEILWRETYEDSNSRVDWIHEIVETEDGYLIGGRRQKRNYDVDQLLMKVNKNGQLKWSKTYGLPDYFDSVRDIIQRNNNEFVISGGGGNAAGIGEQLLTYKKIFSIDSTGNVQWEWTTTPTEESTIFNLQLTKEGTWTHTENELFQQPDGIYHVRPKLVFRDSSFNVIKEKVYDIPAFKNYFYNLIPASSGGWLAVGQDQVQLTRNGNQENHQMARMVRLDENGDTIWTRTDLVFRDSNIVASRHDLHSVVELSSGSFVAAGDYLKGVYPRDLGFLIKVDKNGCLDTIDCRLTSSSSYFKGLSNDILVYPNPATEQVNFSFNENFQKHKNKQLFISDLTGKVVQQINIAENQINFLWKPEKLSTGIYFYQLTSKKGLLNSGKIVWMP